MRAYPAYTPVIQSLVFQASDDVKWWRRRLTGYHHPNGVDLHRAMDQEKELGFIASHVAQVSVYLVSLRFGARARSRLKFDGCLPHTQNANLRWSVNPTEAELGRVT